MERSTAGSERPLLKVEGLRKRYPSFELDVASFSVGRGSITGFVGRNGAGKTTALKCIVGSARRDAGSVEAFGRPLDGNEAAIKQITGIVLGGALYYETKRLSAIAAAARRFYELWDERAYEDLMRRFSLDGSKRVRELSQGMRVKFALAMALSHGAKLLVLDEPTSGLDPLSRDELLDLFLDLVSDGERGILFSTHITSDLDKCADSIVHIRGGRIEAACPLGEYRARYRIAAADEARRAGAEMLGVRRTSRGDTALVPAGAGIGREASLEKIMTHLDREETR
ncbi:ATP-binding cassette domain-containing protein [Gordonibacter urolithinfaciens]|uniref:ATP-binding cassette domain-containing protein n=1 Tax=Gordonibacter urolithinfaciens TaxID=1335613 RepID=UPI003AAEBD6F